MAGNTFREATKREDKQERVPEAVKADVTPQDDRTEPVYTEYETVKGKPYPAEYFGLTDTWNDPEGGFEEEIAHIDAYLQERIRKGEVGNTKEAVAKELKRIEKMNNLQGESRLGVRIAILADYALFMNKYEAHKKNAYKYGYA